MNKIFTHKTFITFSIHLYTCISLYKVSTDGTAVDVVSFGAAYSFLLLLFTLLAEVIPPLWSETAECVRKPWKWRYFRSILIGRRLKRERLNWYKNPNTKSVSALVFSWCMTIVGFSICSLRSLKLRFWFRWDHSCSPTSLEGHRFS